MFAFKSGVIVVVVYSETETRAVKMVRKKLIEYKKGEINEPKAKILRLKE